MTSRTCVLLFGFLLACGGKTNSTTDGGVDDGGAPGPDCPSSVPPSGSGCAIEGIQCEYGGDIRSTCNEVAICTNGAWTFTKNLDTTCPTPATNPSDCPATYEQVQQGAECSVNAVCDYSTSAATRFCSCAFSGGPPMMDGGFPPNTWQCGNAQPGCPSVRPRIGSPCTQLNYDCAYDYCAVPSGLTFMCDPSTGTWTTGYMNACGFAN